MTHRHLYNETPRTIRVQTHGISLENLAGAESVRDREHDWYGDIPPNSSCLIRFDVDRGSLMTWERTGVGGAAKPGTSHSFQFSQGTSGPKWEHQGRTRGCVLNDPADGDWKIVDEQASPNAAVAAAAAAIMDALTKKGPDS